MVRFGLLAFAVAVMGSAGCAAKLDTVKTFTLPAEGGDWSVVFNLPTQSSEQTVKAEVTSDVPVEVHVYSAKDVAEPRDLEPEQRGQKAVLAKTGVTKETLSIKVPAKEKYLFVVGVPRKSANATGKVRFTN